MVELAALSGRVIHRDRIARYGADRDRARVPAGAESHRAACVAIGGLNVAALRVAEGQVDGVGDGHINIDRIAAAGGRIGDIGDLRRVGRRRGGGAGGGRRGSARGGAGDRGGGGHRGGCCAGGGGGLGGGRRGGRGFGGGRRVGRGGGGRGGRRQRVRGNGDQGRGGGRRLGRGGRLGGRAGVGGRWRAGGHLADCIENIVKSLLDRGAKQGQHADDHQDHQRDDQCIFEQTLACCIFAISGVRKVGCAPPRRIFPPVWFHHPLSLRLYPMLRCNMGARLGAIPSSLPQYGAGGCSMRALHR